MKILFPRSAGDQYNIPKFHGMTKMQYYMCLFGCAMNFFGGPGESAHKQFVKNPGHNTQRRVSEFAKQVANRIYECMLLDIAKNELDSKDNFKLVGGKVGRDGKTSPEPDIAQNRTDCNDSTAAFHEGTHVDDGDQSSPRLQPEPSFQLQGHYSLTVERVGTGTNIGEGSSSVRWHSRNKSKQASGKYALHADLLRVVYREVARRGMNLPVTLEGYTELFVRNISEDKCSTFYAHPHFQGKEWYDWAYVHYIEEHRSKGSGKDSTVTAELHGQYPAKILGFISFPKPEGGCEDFAVARTSVSPVPWDCIQDDFITSFRLSTKFNSHYVMMPLSSIIYPMAVFPDFGGADPSKHFVALPRSSWSDFFGRTISVPENDEDASGIDHEDAVQDVRCFGDKEDIAVDKERALEVEREMPYINAYNTDDEDDD